MNLNDLMQTQRVLWLDLETRAKTPIDCGVYKYAEDKSFEIVLFAYAFGDQPAKVVEWPERDGIPEELRTALLDPRTVCIAHNANFDRECLAAAGERTLRSPSAREAFHIAGRKPERWKDSMILALSVGLPGRLADLCARFKLPADKAKDADGRRLVKKYCVPDAAGRFCDPTPLDQLDWQHFKEYCRLDVEAMREVWRRLPKDNDRPQFWRQWHTDQRINDRGICIDVDLVDACADACTEAQKKAGEALRERSGGRVTGAGQRARIIAELAALGVHMPDLQQSTVEHRLADPSLPPLAREILSARVAGGKASVAKFATLQSAVCRDNRLRGCLQFCGAARTGRWSGRLFQPQNLPRGSLHGDEVDLAIRAFLAGAAAEVLDDVQAAASSCIRGCITADDGMLAVADLSNIEGRTLAWLAGESWKLDAFRAFDAGQGPDIYRATFARTFGGRPEDVTKAQRQVGKILELAMGYGGGVGAFRTFADAYGMDMEAMADLTLADADDYTVEGARRAFDDGAAPEGMSQRVFIACEIVKSRWRAAHPATVRFWRASEDAARDVLGVGAFGASVRVGPHCIFENGGRFGLFARLPSGRKIAWPGASLNRCQKGAFRFLDRSGWAETYGGRLVENLTQAVARDILADAIERVEDEGMPIVMHVHDELICELSAHDDRTDADLARLLATPPDWASDLPLAAAGFTALRYRKD